MFQFCLGVDFEKKENSSIVLDGLNEKVIMLGRLETEVLTLLIGNSLKDCVLKLREKYNSNEIEDDVNAFTSDLIGRGIIELVGVEHD